MIRPTGDALLLAAACPLQEGERLLDVGAGDGSVALLALDRVPDTTATGFERQPALLEAANLNARDMGLAARYRHVCTDIFRAGDPALHHSFDCVATNPPYFSAQSALSSPDPARQASRTAQPDAIGRWLITAFKYLKPKGYLALVWPADRLFDLTPALNTRASHVILLPVRFCGQKAAGRVIVVARKAFRSNAHPQVFLADGLAYYGAMRKVMHHAVYHEKQSLWSALHAQGCALPPYFRRKIFAAHKFGLKKFQNIETAR